MACRLSVAQVDNVRMLVDCVLYSDGTPEPVGMAEAIRKARSVQGSFVWLGLHEPTYDEFDDLALYFAPHPLAIEDAVNAHQRPKLDIYDECLFVVLKTLDFDEARAELVSGEIMLFTGENFMVTVQHGASKVLDPVRRRLEGTPDLLRHGPSAVLYGISDAVVDEYEKIADDVEQELEKLETQVFASEGGADAARIYALKRQVVEFRHAVGPLGHPMRVLTSAHLAGVHPEMEPYFRDVSDHLARVAEKVEGFDNLLTDILTANLAQISILQNEETKQQNEDMRRISAWVAIVAANTVLTGIYGMNFEYMPELQTRYGYFVLIAFMLALDITLYRLFRRSRWL
jgi:magnesium transporter